MQIHRHSFGPKTPKEQKATDRDLDNKAILALADIATLQKTALDEIAWIASAPEDFFVKVRPSKFKEESPMTPTHPTGAAQQAPKPAERILLCFGGPGEPHPFTTCKVTPEESPMKLKGWKGRTEAAFDELEAAPEKAPWPDDPTREKLPPLTAPLVKEYVTRIRLMEKAFDLAFSAIYESDPLAADAICSFQNSYHAILQALLAEAGIEPSKEQS